MVGPPHKLWATLKIQKLKRREVQTLSGSSPPGRIQKMSGSAALPEESKLAAAAGAKISAIPSISKPNATQTPDISEEEQFLNFNIYNPRTWLPAHIFLFCLVYRIGTALICRTTFVPDEYYQSVEVAYHHVFQRGITAWEWNDEHAIRSHVYVLPYILLFRIGKLLGISHTWYYTSAPRVFTAIYVACADLLFYLLALRVASPDVSYSRLAKRGSTGMCVCMCM